MSEKPISDLRCRMLEDMAVRKFGEKTRHDYIRHVAMFAKFLDRSPDTATADDVHRYQVHLTREWRAAADAEQLGDDASLVDDGR